MDIAVCIKQTPVAAEARLDPVTKTLVRQGVALTLSSLDRRALLEALRVRGETGGTVTVLSMGPPQARSVIQEALALGADRGILLSDQAFAGADTLATARTLGLALRRLAPDLIVCGKFTIDSETSQVPSELAEMLDLPQVTSVRKIRPNSQPGTLWVERETDDGYEQYELSLPALLSVTELVISGRRPTPQELEAAMAKPIDVWTAADLGADPGQVGAAGSPTWVAEIRSAQLERQGTVLADLAPEAAAQRIADFLLEHGLFKAANRRATLRPRRQPPASPDPQKAILVVAELLQGDPRAVTYELLGKAQELTAQLGGGVAVVLLGGPQVASHAPAMAAYGADTVYLAADSRLANYDTERYAMLVATAIQRLQPFAVLFPSTTNGRDLAPRVAARLQLGLTGDCVGLELDADGKLAQLKPAFGGNIVSPIYTHTRPAMATVRPGMVEPCEPNWAIPPRIVPLTVPATLPSRVNLLQSVVEPELDAHRLDNASVVVGIGMGIGGTENVPVVRQLAEVLDAPVSISLSVAAARWLPSQLQLGLTGKAVAPRFYLAIGISGQPNHLVGVKKAEYIIAVNNNPKAPIFQSANLGVVADWAQVVPALTRCLQEAKGRLRPG